MDTAARKARKRAGEKFVKAPKVGTPLLERSFFTGLVPAFHGTVDRGKLVPRSPRKIKAALKARGIEQADD